MASARAFGVRLMVESTNIPPGLTSAVGAVLVTGFLLKDFVFEWSPWKIYRAKNHATLHFRWKR